MLSVNLESCCADEIKLNQNVHDLNPQGSQQKKLKTKSQNPFLSQLTVAFQYQHVFLRQTDQALLR